VSSFLQSAAPLADVRPLSKQVPLKRRNEYGTARARMPAASAGHNLRWVMKWQKIQNDWHYYKPKAARHWTACAESQLAAIEGDYSRLVDCLQERYGLAREATEEEVRAWSATFGDDEVPATAPVRWQASSIAARLNPQIIARQREPQRTAG
jgi:hypothetical protein